MENPPENCLAAAVLELGHDIAYKAGQCRDPGAVQPALGRVEHCRPAKGGADEGPGGVVLARRA